MADVIDQKKFQQEVAKRELDQAISRNEKDLLDSVTSGGKYQGINSTNVNVNNPAITEKDIADLQARDAKLAQQRAEQERLRQQQLSELPYITENGEVDYDAKQQYYKDKTYEEVLASEAGDPIREAEEKIQRSADESREYAWSDLQNAQANADTSYRINAEKSWNSYIGAKYNDPGRSITYGTGIPAGMTPQQYDAWRNTTDLSQEKNKQLLREYQYEQKYDELSLTNDLNREQSYEIAYNNYMNTLNKINIKQKYSLLELEDTKKKFRKQLDELTGTNLVNTALFENLFNKLATDDPRVGNYTSSTWLQAAKTLASIPDSILGLGGLFVDDEFVSAPIKTLIAIMSDTEDMNYVSSEEDYGLGGFAYALANEKSEYLLQGLASLGSFAATVFGLGKITKPASIAISAAATTKAASITKKLGEGAVKAKAAGQHTSSLTLTALEWISKNPNRFNDFLAVTALWGLSTPSKIAESAKTRRKALGLEYEGVGDVSGRDVGYGLVGNAIDVIGIPLAGTAGILLGKGLSRLGGRAIGKESASLGKVGSVLGRKIGDKTALTLGATGALIGGLSKFAAVGATEALSESLATAIEVASAYGIDISDVLATLGSDDPADEELKVQLMNAIMTSFGTSVGIHGYNTIVDTKNVIQTTEKTKDILKESQANIKSNLDDMVKQGKMTEADRKQADDAFNSTLADNAIEEAELTKILESGKLSEGGKAFADKKKENLGKEKAGIIQAFKSLQESNKDNGAELAKKSKELANEFKEAKEKNKKIREENAKIGKENKDKNESEKVKAKPLITIVDILQNAAKKGIIDKQALLDFDILTSKYQKEQKENAEKQAEKSDKSFADKVKDAANEAINKGKEAVNKFTGKESQKEEESKNSVDESQKDMLDVDVTQVYSAGDIGGLKGNNGKNAQKQFAESIKKEEEENFDEKVDATIGFVKEMFDKEPKSEEEKILFESALLDLFELKNNKGRYTKEHADSVLMALIARAIPDIKNRQGDMLDAVRFIDEEVIAKLKAEFSAEELEKIRPLLYNAVGVMAKQLDEETQNALSIFNEDEAILDDFLNNIKSLSQMLEAALNGGSLDTQKDIQGLKAKIDKNIEDSKAKIEQLAKIADSLPDGQTKDIIIRLIQEKSYKWKLALDKLPALTEALKEVKEKVNQELKDNLENISNENKASFLSKIISDILDGFKVFFRDLIDRIASMTPEQIEEFDKTIDVVIDGIQDVSEVTKKYADFMNENIEKYKDRENSVFDSSVMITDLYREEKNGCKETGIGSTFVLPFATIIKNAMHKHILNKYFNINDDSIKTAIVSMLHTLITDKLSKSTPDPTTGEILKIFFTDAEIGVLKTLSSNSKSDILTSQIRAYLDKRAYRDVFLSETIKAMMLATVEAININVTKTGGIHWDGFTIIDTQFLNPQGNLDKENKDNRDEAIKEITGSYFGNSFSNMDINKQNAWLSIGLSMLTELSRVHSKEENKRNPAFTNITATKGEMIVAERLSKAYNNEEKVNSIVKGKTDDEIEIEENKLDESKATEQVDLINDTKDTKEKDDKKKINDSLQIANELTKIFQTEGKIGVLKWLKNNKTGGKHFKSAIKKAENGDSTNLMFLIVFNPSVTESPFVNLTQDIKLKEKQLKDLEYRNNAATVSTKPRKLEAKDTLNNKFQTLLDNLSNVSYSLDIGTLKFYEEIGWLKYFSSEIISDKEYYDAMNKLKNNIGQNNVLDYLYVPNYKEVYDKENGKVRKERNGYVKLNIRNSGEATLFNISKIYKNAQTMEKYNITESEYNNLIEHLEEIGQARMFLTRDRDINIDLYFEWGFQNQGRLQIINTLYNFQQNKLIRNMIKKNRDSEIIDNDISISELANPNNTDPRVELAQIAIEKIIILCAKESGTYPARRVVENGKIGFEFVNEKDKKYIKSIIEEANKGNFKNAIPIIQAFLDKNKGKYDPTDDDSHDIINAKKLLLAIAENKIDPFVFRAHIDGSATGATQKSSYINRASPDARKGFGQPRFFVDGKVFFTKENAKEAFLMLAREKEKEVDGVIVDGVTVLDVIDSLKYDYPYGDLVYNLYHQIQGNMPIDTDESNILVAALRDMLGANQTIDGARKLSYNEAKDMRKQIRDIAKTIATPYLYNKNLNNIFDSDKEDSLRESIRIHLEGKILKILENYLDNYETITTKLLEITNDEDDRYPPIIKNIAKKISRKISEKTDRNGFRQQLRGIVLDIFNNEIAIENANLVIAQISPDAFKKAYNHKGTNFSLIANSDEVKRINAVKKFLEQKIKNRVGKLNNSINNDFRNIIKILKGKYDKASRTRKVDLRKLTLDDKNLLVSFGILSSKKDDNGKYKYTVNNKNLEKKYKSLQQAFNYYRNIMYKKDIYSINDLLNEGIIYKSLESISANVAITQEAGNIKQEIISIAAMQAEIDSSIQALKETLNLDEIVINSIKEDIMKLKNHNDRISAIKNKAKDIINNNEKYTPYKTPLLLKMNSRQQQLFIDKFDNYLSNHFSDRGLSFKKENIKTKNRVSFKKQLEKILAESPYSVIFGDMDLSTGKVSKTTRLDSIDSIASSVMTIIEHTNESNTILDILNKFYLHFTIYDALDVPLVFAEKIADEWNDNLVKQTAEYGGTTLTALIEMIKYTDNFVKQGDPYSKFNGVLANLSDTAIDSMIRILQSQNIVDSSPNVNIMVSGVKVPQGVEFNNDLRVYGTEMNSIFNDDGTIKDGTKLSSLLSQLEILLNGIKLERNKDEQKPTEKQTKKIARINYLANKLINTLPNYITDKRFVTEDGVIVDENIVFTDKLNLSKKPFSVEFKETKEQDLLPFGADKTEQTTQTKVVTIASESANYGSNEIPIMLKIQKRLDMFDDNGVRKSDEDFKEEHKTKIEAMSYKNGVANYQHTEGTELTESEIEKIKRDSELKTVLNMEGNYLIIYISDDGTISPEHESLINDKKRDVLVYDSKGTLIRKPNGVGIINDRNIFVFSTVEGNFSIPSHLVKLDKKPEKILVSRYKDELVDSNILKDYLFANSQQDKKIFEGKQEEFLTKADKLAKKEIGKREYNVYEFVKNPLKEAQDALKNNDIKAAYEALFRLFKPRGIKNKIIPMLYISKENFSNGLTNEQTVQLGSMMEQVLHIIRIGRYNDIVNESKLDNNGKPEVILSSYEINGLLNKRDNNTNDEVEIDEYGNIIRNQEEVIDDDVDIETLKEEDYQQMMFDLGEENSNSETEGDNKPDDNTPSNNSSVDNSNSSVNIDNKNSLDIEQLNSDVENTIDKIDNIKKKDNTIERNSLDGKPGQLNHKFIVENGAVIDREDVNQSLNDFMNKIGNNRIFNLIKNMLSRIIENIPKDTVFLVVPKEVLKGRKGTQFTYGGKNYVVVSSKNYYAKDDTLAHEIIHAGMMNIFQETKFRGALNILSHLRYMKQNIIKDLEKMYSTEHGKRLLEEMGFIDKRGNATAIWHAIKSGIHSDEEFAAYFVSNPLRLEYLLNFRKNETKEPRIDENGNIINKGNSLGILKKAVVDFLKTLLQTFSLGKIKFRNDTTYTYADEITAHLADLSDYNNADKAKALENSIYENAMGIMDNLSSNFIARLPVFNITISESNYTQKLKNKGKTQEDIDKIKTEIRQAIVKDLISQPSGYGRTVNALWTALKAMFWKTPLHREVAITILNEFLQEHRNVATTGVRNFLRAFRVIGDNNYTDREKAIGAKAAIDKSINQTMANYKEFLTNILKFGIGEKRYDDLDKESANFKQVKNYDYEKDPYGIFEFSPIERLKRAMSVFYVTGMSVGNLSEHHKESFKENFKTNIEQLFYGTEESTQEILEKQKDNLRKAIWQVFNNYGIKFDYNKITDEALLFFYRELDHLAAQRLYGGSTRQGNQNINSVLFNTTTQDSIKLVKGNKSLTLRTLFDIMSKQTDAKNVKDIMNLHSVLHNITTVKAIQLLKKDDYSTNEEINNNTKFHFGYHKVQIEVMKQMLDMQEEMPGNFISMAMSLSAEYNNQQSASHISSVTVTTDKYKQYMDKKQKLLSMLKNTTKKDADKIIALQKEITQLEIEAFKTIKIDSFETFDFRKDYSRDIYETFGNNYDRKVITVNNVNTEGLKAIQMAAEDYYKGITRNGSTTNFKDTIKWLVKRGFQIVNPLDNRPFVDFDVNSKEFDRMLSDVKSLALVYDGNDITNEVTTAYLLQGNSFVNKGSELSENLTMTSDEKRAVAEITNKKKLSSIQNITKISEETHFDQIFEDLSKTQERYTSIAGSTKKFRTIMSRFHFNALTKADISMESVIMEIARNNYKMREEEAVNADVINSMIEDQIRMKNEGKMDVVKKKWVKIFSSEYDRQEITKEQRLRNERDLNRVATLAPNVLSQIRILINGYNENRVLKDQITELYVPEELFELMAGIQTRSITGWMTESLSNMKEDNPLKRLASNPKFVKGLQKLGYIINESMNDTKTTIVIRNYRVLFANIFSQCISMAGLGLSASNIISDSVAIFEDIQRFEEDTVRMYQLENNYNSIVKNNDINDERIAKTLNEIKKEIDMLRDRIIKNRVYFPMTYGADTNIMDETRQDDTFMSSLYRAGYNKITWALGLDKVLDKIGINKEFIRENAIYSANSLLYKWNVTLNRYSDMIPKIIAYEKFYRDGYSQKEAMNKAQTVLINYNTPLESALLRNAERIGLIPYARFAVRVLPALFASIGDRPISTTLSIVAGSFAELVANAFGLASFVSKPIYSEAFTSLPNKVGDPFSMVIDPSNMFRWGFIFD